MFMWVISVICLVWMHQVVQNMMREEHPEGIQDFERIK
tara:strand:- start:398 stop:511 length:114 start_codon:yes stop_codon:yes gene_type:complete